MEIKEKDNLVKQSIKNKRLENLTKKQAEKPKIEQERPTYYFMVVASKLIQLLTALLASCGFYAFLNDFIDNPTVILIVCIIALAWMERTIGKNFSIISINKLLAREQHFSIIALSVFLVALSVASTYLGTESTISFYKKKPVLHNLDLIAAKYDTIQSENTKAWTAKATAFTAVAEDIHAKNNWRGVTSRSARGAVLANKESAKNMQDSLIKYQAIIATKKDKAIQQAKQDNIMMLQDHETMVKKYSNIFEVVSLFAYVLLFVFIYLIERYEIWEKEYLELSLKGKEEPIKEPTKDERTKDKERGKEGIKKGAKDEKTMQFQYAEAKYKDWDIQYFDNPNKKPRIYVALKDSNGNLTGKVKDYKASELKGLIKSNKGVRSTELKQYLNKLENESK